MASRQGNPLPPVDPETSTFCRPSGDVDFLTLSQSLTDEPHLKEKRVTDTIRYILVLNDARHHLTDFLCTRDLVNAVYDAAHVLARASALSEHKFRHCNISVGNIAIILDKDRKFKQGLLFDWDLCNDQMKSRASERNRIGTGQFMSAALLEDPFKEPTIMDDLESLLHVLLWTTLRHVPLKMRHTRTHAHWDYLFNEHSRDTTYSGKTKGKWLASGAIYLDDWEFKRSSPLLELLYSLCIPFMTRYQKDPPSTGVSKSTLKIHKEVTECPFLFARWIKFDLEEVDTWPEDDGSSTLPPLDGSQD